MRKCLITAVLALTGFVASANRASAWDHYGIIVQPYYTPVAFPMITPSGWFSNSYYFPWYYPWYVNYGYANGYYANWWLGGGYAAYAGQMMPAVAVAPGQVQVIVVEQKKGAVLPPPRKDLKQLPKKGPGKVAIHVPADAQVLFNGLVAGGRGEKRTFVTPDLEPGQDYEYVLTAEVLRDGEKLRVTERAIIRAGEETSVTLSPTAAVRK